MSTSPVAAPRDHKAQVRRRRVAAVLTVIVLVVGGTAAFTAIVWPGFATAESLVAMEAAAPVVVPVLGLEPAPRIGEQTRLVAALPDVADTWVQSGIAVYNGWQVDDAVEAWTATYTNGLAGGDAGVKASTIEVTVGQWQKFESAAAFYRAQTKGITNIAQGGDVTLAGTGEVNGRYLIAPLGTTNLGSGAANPDASTVGENQGVMWWRNGTVVIKATGPIDQLPRFFSSYPL